MPAILRFLKTSAQGTARAVEAVPAPQGWYPSAAIVLLTDGENNESPDPALAADLAADLGVRVYTVGIGSPAGVEPGSGRFYSSSPVSMSSRCNSLQRRPVELITMQVMRSNCVRFMRISSRSYPSKPEKVEMTSIFAGIGMLVFLDWRHVVAPLVWSWP